ncbi:MAG: Na+/H+ antiporter NhaC, partial [Firmicutes bacterium]|nr:Na+/H+ antiporter NhaC [Bacillota bacterium]
TAGAIASGALCGDKLSPMSNSPNVTCAVSRTNLFDGCVHAAKTSLPALVICLVFYLVLGFGDGASAAGTSSEEYQLILDQLSTIFHLNPLLLLPPVVVIVLIMMKKPTLPTFAAGIVLAAALAVIFQGASISELAGVMSEGYTTETCIGVIDDILIRGGLSSFLGVDAILISACVFYAPLTWLAPVIGFIYVLTGFTITKTTAVSILPAHPSFSVFHPAPRELHL